MSGCLDNLKGIAFEFSKRSVENFVECIFYNICMSDTFDTWCASLIQVYILVFNGFAVEKKLLCTNFV